MCTRYLLLEEQYRTILKLLGVKHALEFLTRFNIAPGGLIPAIRNAPGKYAEPKREAVGLRWGLIPSWSKDGSGVHPSNARAETIFDKPTFRQAVRARRCVIPASGFYEWEHRGQIKQSWLFRRTDEQAFGLAGIWESWRHPDGTEIETCAVITNEPNELMKPIHHRMPVMLTPEQFESWLDPTTQAPAQLAPLIRTPPASTMKAVEVGTYVSNSRHEGPQCIEPATGRGSPQLSLGI